MPAPLSGPGVGLQVPQQLYPANLANSEITASTNKFGLAPGEALPIPAGRWFVSLGKYCSLQYLDPVTTAWAQIRDLDNNGSAVQIWSDGFNVRVANLTGCVVGATVTNGGSGAYVSGTTTITPSTGNSVWQAIVGGAVATSGGTSITAVGAGYGIAPLVFVDAPPAPGVAATAVANISGGTVTSLTWLSQGAGYLTAPNITIVTNPADPNINTAITQATAVASLTGAGSITAAILLNSGAPVATSMTLTVTGAGTTATVVPLFLETVTTLTVVAGGGGFGTFTQITTQGGYNTNTGAFIESSNMLGFVPRPAVIGVALATGGITSQTTILDGGLFLNTANPVAVTNGLITTVASLTVGVGGTNDSVTFQQLA